MSSPIAYTTQTLQLGPKSLKDPNTTRVLGTPGLHIPSDMDPPPCPQGYGDQGPQNGDPHFTQIPAQKWFPGRILAAKKRLPGPRNYH